MTMRDTGVVLSNNKDKSIMDGTWPNLRKNLLIYVLKLVLRSLQSFDIRRTGGKHRCDQKEKLY